MIATSPRIQTGKTRSSGSSREAGRLTHGAARGAVAAMSMTGLRTLTVRLGLLEQLPPEVAVQQPGVHRVLSRVGDHDRQVALVELLHWAYGATGGAVFAALPSQIRSRAGAGPLFGLLLWAGFEVVLAPVLGMSEGRRRSLAERVALIADHLLYGAVLAELRGRPQR